MRSGTVYMFLTTTAAVTVYYYWSVVLQLNDTLGMFLGVTTAVILSGLFTRRQRRK